LVESRGAVVAASDAPATIAKQVMQNSRGITRQRSQAVGILVPTDIHLIGTGALMITILSGVGIHA
jgi:hypothetical protein